MTMSTANLLAVQTTHDLGEVVLECVGEIDLSSSGALAAGLDSAVVAAGGRLVVDLMGVSFIDLSGVACLLRGKQRCTVLGAAFEVVAPRPGDTFPIDGTVAGADASDSDGLVLPGGVINPDALRTDEAAVRFVRSFFEGSKPVGAICHGPWMLVEAGVVDGARVTSWPSLQTDLRNAGAEWVDEQVVTDNGLVTSRKRDDLEAFCAKIVEEFAEGVHNR